MSIKSKIQFLISFLLLALVNTYFLIYPDNIYLENFVTLYEMFMWVMGVILIFIYTIAIKLIDFPYNMLSEFKETLLKKTNFINELKSKKPRILLYWSKLDVYNFNDEKRIPLIIQYIKSNYTTYNKTDDWHFLIRK